MRNRRHKPPLRKRCFDKIVTGLRRFGLRIAVHFFSLGAALFAIFSRPMPGREKGIVFLSTYIGLVCLFSRETAIKASWLIPFGSGLVQCGILLLLGFHFHLAVFFGGLQTWVQRIIGKRGNNGTEWFAVFFLLMAGSTLITRHNSLRILPGFLIVTFVGVLAGKLCAIREFRKAYGKKLQKSLERIESASLSTGFSSQTGQVAEEILGTARKHEDTLKKDSREARAVIDAISDAAAHLDACLRSENPEISSEASEENIRIPLEKTLAQLKAFLSSRQKPETEDAAKNEKEKKKPETPSGIHVFKESAAALVKKSNHLPKRMHGYVKGIHKSTLAIIECLRTDPTKDMTPGTRFLERYLPATHRVLDEYLRLSREEILSTELESILGLSAELLARLEKAFSDEHAALMKNDVLHFTAELKVLDSLLKMDGR